MAWILVNKRADAVFDVRIADVIAPGTRLHRVCRDGSPGEGEAVPDVVHLEGAEVVYVLPG